MFVLSKTALAATLPIYCQYIYFCFATTLKVIQLGKITPQMSSVVWYELEMHCRASSLYWRSVPPPPPISQLSWWAQLLIRSARHLWSPYWSLNLTLRSPEKQPDKNSGREMGLSGYLWAIWFCLFGEGKVDTDLALGFGSRCESHMQISLLSPSC